MVGILVEEALRARGFIDFKNTNDLIRTNRYVTENNMNYSSLKYNELDELISDKGITYNTKKHNSNDISYEPIESYNEELFEQFKQFVLFQKMKKGK